MGYMARLLALNASDVKEVLLEHRARYRRHVLTPDVALFSELSGVPPDWFQWRIPRFVEGDRWTEVELFGLRWRGDWLLRGTHQQICPECLRERGFARLEWDLQAYAACHVHGIVLQDSCHGCGKAILPDRPALEVCSCTSFLTRHKAISTKAPTAVVAWSAWLSHALIGNDGGRTENIDDGLPPPCGGSTPDGAYRLIQAMAGGPRAMRGEVMHGVSPWLSSSSTVQLLQVGLDAFRGFAAALQKGRGPDRGTADALAEQSVRGVSAWDRAIAGKLVASLQVRSRWRNMKPGYQHQLELFEGQP